MNGSRRRIAGGRPAIAVTYEKTDPQYLEAVLPLVDYLEVTPDAIAVASAKGPIIPSGTLDELASCGRDVGIVIHGVGLSIGSADKWSDEYLLLLDQVVERLPVEWHSEHLGYVTVAGRHLGTMLPVPRTEEALDLICQRVETLRERYALPFLLENVVRVLPDSRSEYSDSQFLNALADRSGCGLLLDVYNLECDAHNNALDIADFLAHLNLKHVREMHVASGVELEGVLLDVHSRPLRESTLRLMRDILERPEVKVDLVTYELLAEAVPILGDQVICDELGRLRAAIAA